MRGFLGVIRLCDVRKFCDAKSLGVKFFEVPKSAVPVSYSNALARISDGFLAAANQRCHLGYGPFLASGLGKFPDLPRYAFVAVLIGFVVFAPVSNFGDAPVLTVWVKAASQGSQKLINTISLMLVSDFLQTAGHRGVAFFFCRLSCRGREYGFSYWPVTSYLAIQQHKCVVGVIECRGREMLDTL
jgi:hypothetical protein